MTTLYGKSLDELTSIATAEGLPKFTAKQIASWIYNKDATSIEQMTNISKQARELLSSKFCIGIAQPTKVSESTDGTKKYLFAVDNNFVEAAYIPEPDRATLCVSSQVGCKMGCEFCMTSKQGFQQDLNVNQILNQIRSIPEFRNVSNIVFMGMGEPFNNLDNVLKSTEVITANWGFGWSPKRITISSVGVIPSLIRFIEQSSCHLAISLHNPFHDERLKMMPVEGAYPIAKVIDVIRQYNWHGQRRVSFEYIMFDGINDSPRHINELANLLGGLECRVNLIRFHSIPNSPFKASPDKRIVEFRNKLTTKGVFTTIRASRGQDIKAACGLLSTAEQNRASKW